MVFYITLAVAEHLSQLWPLLLLAFASIAVCHLAARKCAALGSSAAKCAALNSSTAKSGNSSCGTLTTGTGCAAVADTKITASKNQLKTQYSDVISSSNGEYFFSAPRKSSCFEFTHPPVIVINTSFGRNLLNKKEAPPSTIKESSESSQTIDDQDSDKGTYVIS
ncbi:unnamed protein product [Gongylonema pulchrum]|uniref:Secreted protein n=1 Tax=Gongylonema pulchrum TaxID=637853 RepID=A0A183D5W6_9BILA|nr:unnamed protein product [Gongylonema pulchrum]